MDTVMGYETITSCRLFGCASLLLNGHKDDALYVGFLMFSLSFCMEPYSSPCIREEIATIVVARIHFPSIE